MADPRYPIYSGTYSTRRISELKLSMHGDAYMTDNSKSPAAGRNNFVIYASSYINNINLANRL